MKGLKKVLSIILAIVIVVSIVPITASGATSGTCGDNLTWIYDSGTLTISGAGSMDDYSSSNRPWESYEDNIKKVVINNSVTTIGSYAFDDCDSLTDVTLGDNITSIGCAAFRYCYNLTSINIPNSVTTINDNVFFSCIRLERVTIPACLVTIGSGAFRYCDSLTSITVNGNNEYYSSDEYGVLFNKERTELIQYPTGNTRTSYTIPSSVTTIRDYAFSSCDSLKNVTVINGVTFIGECAFSFCHNLESVLIGDSVTSIGYQAFYDCHSLTSITVNGNNEYYSSDEYGVLFNKEKTELIQYPTGSTRISYTIPDDVITIGDYSFYDCDSLASIKIGDTTTTLGYMAFYDCDSLTSITLPNSATSIGAYAFAYCNSLTSITILDNIIYVGSCAFYYCGSLTNVYYSGTKEQWNKISIDSNNWCLTNATIHYNSTGPDSDGTDVEIFFGTDENGFGEDIAGYVGEEVEAVLIYKNSVNNTSALDISSSNTDVVEIGTIRIGSGDYNNEVERDAYVTLKFKSIGTSTITITSPEGISESAIVIVSDVCNLCGEKIAVIDAGVSATCTATGLTAGSHCDVCGEVLVEQDEIPIVAHNYNAVVTVPTCTAKGYTTYICTACGDSYVADETEMVAHTEGEVVVENEVSATCTVTGSFDNVVYCTKCGIEMQRNTVTVNALPHYFVNGVCAYCGENETSEKSLAVLSTNKSFTVKTGDKMGLSFGIMTNGMLEEDWKKMSIVVSDPTIVSLGNYKETDYGYAIDITGLKEGLTNLAITDAETGLSTSIVVSVFDEYTETYSFSIENIATFHPNNSWEDHLNTCIYDMNGLYVDNYSATKSGDKYIVTFDAYNQRYHHGAVDIYDADCNWIGSEQIEKYSDISSLYDTGEQIYYMIFGSSWVTYQHAIQSKKTSIEIEVPDGGYFTVSNNFAASHGTFFYNLSEILFDASMTWLEATVDYAVGDIDIDAGDLAKLLIDNVLENPNARDAWVEIFKTTIKDLLINFEKDVLSGSIDKAYSNLSTEVESILYSALKIDWKNLLKTASGIGESAFEKFAGPAGIVLKGCFFATEQLNRFYQAEDIVYSIHEAYATVYSSIDEGFINPYGVTVNTNGNMDAEAVLQVFRISNDDCVDVILDNDNPLEHHELYNICFVKDDKLVQPNGKVKVYVPIPEGMNSNTCVIYRQETDDSWTILDAKIEGNYLVFETDHFSLYVIVGDEDELKITSLPNKLTYTRNDVLDITGLVLNINGQTITEGYYCDPAIMYEYGTQTITLKYGKATAEFEVNVLEEPEYNYTFSIRNPSRTEIRNKDGIILHANVEGNAPSGSYVKWESSNGNFDKSADDSNLKIIAKNKGWTTFTAILCDADGNELARDSVEMYSKSGFFDKIGGFFRSLFGTTKVYEN